MRQRRRRATKPTKGPPRPYQPLPKEMRPRYIERSDLRLLEQAFHYGWVDDAPIERKKEWVEDIACALHSESNCTKRTALRTMLAVFFREEYLKERAMELWALLPLEEREAIREAIRKEAEAAGQEGLSN